MEKLEKIILGIDPGTARMGYGVIKHINPEIECLEYGVIETKAGIDIHIRLKDIYNSLQSIIEKYKPNHIAIEDIFYFKNQKTLIQVAGARGVALLAAAQSTGDCYSFTPLQVKQAVTGYGQADKQQVQQMTKALLGISSIPKPDDAADALAIAICCAHSVPQQYNI